MSLALRIYTDYICPFCYLHHVVVDRLAAGEDWRVRWIPIEIHPETPAEGAPLDSNGGYARLWAARIAPAARELGVDLAFPRFLPNSRRAIRATVVADRQGRGDAFHARVLRAYWQDGRDIGRDDVLEVIAREVGCDTREFGAACDAAEVGEVVAAAATAAADDLATGVPTTMLGQFPLLGLQMPDELRAYVSRYQRQLARTPVDADGA